MSDCELCTGLLRQLTVRYKLRYPFAQDTRTLMVRPFHRETHAEHIPYRLKKNRLKVWSAEILVG